MPAAARGMRWIMRRSHGAGGFVFLAFFSCSPRHAARAPLSLGAVAGTIKRGLHLRPPLFNPLICDLCAKNRAELARELLGRMPLLGCPPDVFSYTILVKGLCRKGRADVALKVLEEMTTGTPPCEPDVFLYSAVIDGLCKEGSLDGALSLVAEMKSRGVSPNIVTHNTIVNGLCRKGRTSAALELLRDLSLQDSACKPNVVTFTTVIDRLCEEGSINEAIALIEEMASVGVPPNIVTYNILVKGLCKKGNADAAAEFPPVDDCRRPVLQARRVHLQHRNQPALCGRSSDRSPGTLPATSPPTLILIKGHCRAGDLAVALRLLTSMVESQSFCKADVITYNTVINGLCEH